MGGREGVGLGTLCWHNLSIIGVKTHQALIIDVDQTINNSNVAPRNVFYWSTNIHVPI